MISLRTLLWIDCTAGATAGCAVLALAAGGQFSSLTGLPSWLPIFMGLANLLYAAFSKGFASISPIWTVETGTPAQLMRTIRTRTGP